MASLRLTSLSRAVRFPLQRTMLRFVAPFPLPARFARPVLSSPALLPRVAPYWRDARKKAMRPLAPRLAQRQDFWSLAASRLLRLPRDRWLARAGDPSRQAAFLLRAHRSSTFSFDSPEHQ